MRHPLVAAIVLLTILLAVPALLARDEMPVTNEKCPVMEGEPTDPGIYTFYRGVRVHLCCEDCVADFDRNPEEYLVNLPPSLVAQMEPLAVEDPDQGSDEEPEESSDEEIGAAEESSRSKHPYGLVHPLIVHFMVALTAVAVLAAFFGLFGGTFMRNTAIFLLVISALLAWPTVWFGEEAADMLGEGSAARAERIEHHEDWGERTQWVVIGVGIATLALGFLGRTFVNRLAVFVLAAVAAGMVGYTGYLGGEVRLEGHLQPLFDALGIG